MECKSLKIALIKLKKPQESSSRGMLNLVFPRGGLLLAMCEGFNELIVKMGWYRQRLSLKNEGNRIKNQSSIQQNKKPAEMNSILKAMEKGRGAMEQGPTKMRRHPFSRKTFKKSNRNKNLALIELRNLNLKISVRQVTSQLNKIRISSQLSRLSTIRVVS